MAAQSSSSKAAQFIVDAPATQVIWGEIESISSDSRDESSLENQARCIDGVEMRAGPSEGTSSDDDFKVNQAEGDQPDKVGSAYPSTHWTGECRPCLFNQSKVGCNNGSDCTFCHYEHTNFRVPRACKAKRDRARRYKERMDTEQGKTQEETEGDAPRSEVPRSAAAASSEAPKSAASKKHTMSL